MSRAPSARSLVLQWFALALLLGCDGLGNPLPLEGRTPPTAWFFPYGKFITESRTVPIAEVRALQGGPVDFRDTDSTPGRVATLIAVRAAWSRTVVPAHLDLVTTFEFPGRRPLERKWQVTGYLGRWRGLFALPAVPIGAITRIE